MVLNIKECGTDYLYSQSDLEIISIQAQFWSEKIIR